MMDTTSAGDITWEPDGHQASMLDDPDCRTLICAALTRGEFDGSAAQAAFDALLARHSILRSHYSRAPDGRPLVVTPPRVCVPVSVADLRAIPPHECREALLRIDNALTSLPWDAYRGPLVACAIARLPNEVILFLVSMHRSLGDAASLNIIRSDLIALYRSALLHTPSPLQAITVEFRDFVSERAQWLRSDQALPHLGYWRGVFAGAHSLFRLPYDRRVPTDTDPVRPDITGSIPLSVLGRLRDISASECTTLSSLFSALLVIVLASWSSRTDVAVWVCHLGRQRQELFRVVGCFMDHWLLRLDVLPAARFVDLLRRIHQLTISATPHLRVTLHRLIPELQRISAGDVHPGIVVNFMPFAKASGAAITAELSAPQRAGRSLSRTSPIGLIVNCYEFADHLRWTLVHNSNLFEDSTIARFSAALAALAERVARDPYLTPRDLLPERMQA